MFHWKGGFAGSVDLDVPVYTIALSPSGTTLLGAAEEPFPQIVVWRLTESGTSQQSDLN